MGLENYAAMVGQFDPIGVDQKIAALKEAQNTNRLADFAFAQKQREQEEGQRLNDIYRNSLDASGKIDLNTLETGAAKAGLGSRLPALKKSFLENDKIAAETGDKKASTKKHEAETAKVAQETAAHQFEVAGQLAGAWANDPTVTKEKIQRGLAAALNAKIIPQEIYDTKIGELESTGGDPQSLNGWAKNTLMQVMKAKDQFALTTPDANTVLNNKTSSENNAATNATSRANNAATVAATIRGQDIKAAAGAAKPLPASALKMQQEELDAIGSASGINSDLGAVEKQISDGTLKFGLVSNLINRGRNLAGASTEESRNFSSFKSTLEKLRNDSLRLNKGVQTEGDAVRAWNELFENINDQGVVSQRLGEIKKMNERAVNLRKMNIDNIRSNFGHEPLDTSRYEKQDSAVGGNNPAADANKQTMKNDASGSAATAVTLPNGNVKHFSNAAQAAAFRKAAGL